MSLIELIGYKYLILSPDLIDLWEMEPEELVAEEKSDGNGFKQENKITNRNKGNQRQDRKRKGKYRGNRKKKERNGEEGLLKKKSNDKLIKKKE